MRHIPTLSDLTAFSILLKWFPEDLVEEALEKTGRQSFRLRALPAEFVFYFILVRSFYKDLNATEVLRIVLEGVDRVYGKRGAKIVDRSAIHHALTRLGPEPLKLVFKSACVPIAQPSSRCSFFKEWRVVAIDGCYINVADTQKNSDEFGRPSNQSDTPSGFPQIKMVCLAECGTHVVFDMVTGHYDDAELVLAQKVIPSLTPSMIALMDRLYFGYSTWLRACGTGAALLWRVRSDSKLHPQEILSDDSYTAHYYPSSKDHENKDKPPILLRVIEYEITHPETKKKETIRLVTNILDSEQASALELAKLYMQRWEIEITYGEIKVRLNHNQISLRSGTPELAEQELYGLFLAHNAVRCAIYEAASARKKPADPDDFSFTSALRIIRRKMLKVGDFPP